MEEWSYETHKTRLTMKLSRTWSVIERKSASRVHNTYGSLL